MPEFMGVSFDVARAQDWRQRLLAAPERFCYLVTPNVDHVLRLRQDAEVRAAYDAARWRLCDSRILARLARSRGLDLMPYPGADLVSDLLHDPGISGKRVAVLGPGKAAFQRLSQRFPKVDFLHIDAPMMQRGDAAWERALQEVEDSRFDLLLLCISFPKQEFFALDLLERGAVRPGFALCVGASVDFLTGGQRRAPEWMRRAGLEWLFRLMSDPVRLWRRYLWDGPRIFWHFWRDGRR